MTGKGAIELIVEEERGNAFRAVEKQSGVFVRLADALTAEAALRDRRPEWVAWARERAKELRSIAKRVGRFIDSYRSAP